MIDFLSQYGEVFGAFLLCLIILAFWIKELKSDKAALVKEKELLSTDNKELSADLKDMSAKAIEVMTLAQENIRTSGINDEKLANKIDDLKEAVRNNSCNYGN